MESSILKIGKVFYADEFTIKQKVIGEDGNEITSFGETCTDFLDCSANCIISIYSKCFRSIAFYNAEKAFLKRVMWKDITGSAAVLIAANNVYTISPKDARYMRISTNNIWLDEIMVKIDDKSDVLLGFLKDRYAIIQDYGILSPSERYTRVRDKKT